MSIKDKVIVISGGSDGIGRAFITHARKKGAQIYSLDIQDPAEAADGVRYIQCDISDSNQVEQAFSEIKEPIDILVNNAGVMRRGTIFESTEEDYDALFDVNVKGSWLILKHAESKLRPDAIVVQISSRHGMNPKAEPGIYSIAKQAAVALAEVLKLTSPSYKVKIACPGRVDTPLLYVGRSEKECEEARKSAESPEVVAEKIIELIEGDYGYLLFDEKAGEYKFE